MNATRVTELLQELDRLEQEKVRDGNAEVPWFYLRDHFEDALGLPRGGLDNPPEDEDDDPGTDDAIREVLEALRANRKDRDDG